MAAFTYLGDSSEPISAPQVAEPLAPNSSNSAPAPPASPTGASPEYLRSTNGGTTGRLRWGPGDALDERAGAEGKSAIPPIPPKQRRTYANSVNIAEAD